MLDVRKDWPSYVVIAALGTSSGVGSTVYYLKTTDLQKIARPDPATGTELRALRREVEYHLRHHPDVINHFDRRITRLEARLEVLQEENGR